MNGIYCGRNSTAAVTEEFRIIFLRMEDGRIISLLSHNAYGVIGIVSGMGDVTEYWKETKEDSSYCIKGSDGIKYFNDKALADEMEKHIDDKIEIGDNDEMTYTMYDGTVFSLKLAEKISPDYFDKKDLDDSLLTVSQKMAQWNIEKFCEVNLQSLNAGVDTEKYSVLFSIDIPKKFIYCRVGQNAYCEKGWAMKSTTCIRKNECRMIADNLDTLKAYIPDENCFVADSCAFPADGGWYWSLKSIDSDVIYLNGCSGVLYEIRKK